MFAMRSSQYPRIEAVRVKPEMVRIVHPTFDTVAETNCRVRHAHYQHTFVQGYWVITVNRIKPEEGEFHA